LRVPYFAAWLPPEHPHSAKHRPLPHLPGLGSKQNLPAWPLGWHRWRPLPLLDFPKERANLLPEPPLEFAVVALSVMHWGSSSERLPPGHCEPMIDWSLEPFPTAGHSLLKYP